MATPTRLPLTSSPRPSTIPKRWPSSSPRALISPKRSSPKQSCAAARIPSRAKRSIAMAWSSSRRASTKPRNHQSPRARAPHRRCRQRSRMGSECRLGLRGPLVGAAHGRLHLRPQPHAAYRRHGARARRPQRQRLRQAHHRAAVFAQGHRALGPKAALLAEAEGLTGHAEAIRTRLGTKLERRSRG